MTKKKGKHIDIIKSSDIIRQAIIKRMDELGETNRSLCRRAYMEYDFNITESSISRYINHGGLEQGSLTQRQIIFLMMMLCIPLTLRCELYRSATNEERKDAGGLPQGTLVPVEKKYDMAKAKEQIKKYF